MRLKRAVDRLAFPAILTAIFFAAYWPFKNHPLIVGGVDVRQHLEFGAYAALIFLVVRAVDVLIFDIAVARRDVATPQLLRGIVAFILYAILFTSLFKEVFNYDVKNVITGGAVIAAVLALALQDTLGNLFSGIALHMENTYDIGDVIHSGDYTGVVEAVSWRATRIRAFNNQPIVVPNSLLARERMEVFPKNNLNGRALAFGIDYNVAPANVIGILTQVAAHVDGVAREMPAFARVAAFGDSSITYEIKYFTRDYSARDRIDADIRKAVWYALRRNNIAIPFPIRAFHPYTPPTGDQLSPEQSFRHLREVDVLDPLSDQALQSIAAAVNVHFYSNGEAILRHGSAGNSMFIIHSGNVEIRLPDDSLTGWHQVATLGPGEFFGEMALLTGEARTADVVAMTDVVALEIRKDSLQPILANHPDLARAISHHIMERRQHLDSIKGDTLEEVELTLMSRIRSYFGL